MATRQVLNERIVFWTFVLFNISPFFFLFFASIEVMGIHKRDRIHANTAT